MLINEPKNNEKRIRPTALSSFNAFPVHFGRFMEFHWVLTIDASHANFNSMVTVIRIERTM